MRPRPRRRRGSRPLTAWDRAASIDEERDDHDRQDQRLSTQRLLRRKHPEPINPRKRNGRGGEPAGFLQSLHSLAGENQRENRDEQGPRPEESPARKPAPAPHNNPPPSPPHAP